MLHSLVNHNDDIRWLLEKGYAISLDSNYLVVRDIPYLDEQGNLKTGAIVSKLIFTDPDHVRLEDHQIFFCGSHPCEVNGSPIKNLGGGETALQLVAKDVVVERSFSNKPLTPEGNWRDYIDLFEKIESYVRIISGPAQQLFPNANFLTFRTIESHTDSVFKFNDTLTSRSEIGELANKFKEDVIAVIGLGGTGSYILDFLIRIPIKEIRAFDGDQFYIHNAYRSPGKVEVGEFGRTKAEVYKNRYDEFRHNIITHSKYILAGSTADLQDVTFAFVCVDKGSSRKEIFELLVKLHIPFIDVGMGLNKNNGSVDGMVRTTYYSAEEGQKMVDKKLAPLHDEVDDIYKTNIQLSELNALNACLAVLRFKQLRGFYNDDCNFNHMLFSIHDLHIAGDDN
jgi:molybdopterin/thiamine biosynthesis adenylyltransferase